MHNLIFNRSIFITFVFLVTIHAQDISLTSRVDRNPVVLNEQFVYQVEISGASQNLPDVQMPDLSEFMVVGGPSTSSSVQIVNFKISSSRTYSVVLQPRKIGDFKIGPAHTEFKGESLQSNTVDITVIQQTQQSPAPQPGKTQPRSGDAAVDVSQMVFLKVEPSKRTAYINEEINLLYKIYFRVNIQANEVSRLPEALGCWVEEYPTPRRPSIHSETVNGVRFNVAEIKKVAVFPSKAGNISISPLVMVVDLAVPRQRPRDPFSLFDDFFSDPFSQVVKKEINSGPVELTILEFPVAGKTGEFSGLVGDFSIQSSVDKQALATNEALTYRVKIAGTGLLKSVNSLPLEFSPDFEVFEPRVNEAVNKTGDLVSSSKEFEYVVIPRVPGTQKIKGMRLTYFNPRTRSYKTLQTPEYAIEVSRGKEIAGTPGSGTVFSKEEVRLLGRDIRYIKETLTTLQPFDYRPYYNFWFLVSLVLPLVGLGLAVVYRNHLEKMSTNIQYSRSRKAQKMVQKRLSEAKGFWKHNKPELFYGAIANGIIGYLADKTNKPAAGLLRQDLVQILENSRLDEALRLECLKHLDEADFRRFAPGGASDSDMKLFYQQAEKILVQLEKHF